VLDNWSCPLIHLGDHPPCLKVILDLISIRTTLTAFNPEGLHLLFYNPRGLRPVGGAIWGGTKRLWGLAGIKGEIREKGMGTGMRQ
jgi:hypothetical protein